MSARLIARPTSPTRTTLPFLRHIWKAVLNTWSEDDLSRLLRRLGDETRARQIARAVVAARPLHTTS